MRPGKPPSAERGRVKHQSITTITTTRTMAGLPEYATGLPDGEKSATHRMKARSCHVSNASKRIPVTEDRWKELHDLKGPGQTFDELIAELVEERKKARLEQDMDRIEEEGEFVPLDEA